MPSFVLGWNMAKKSNGGPLVPIISLKAGVAFEKIHQCVVYAVFVASIALSPHKTVVTSLRDGDHIPDSLHYVGRAVDLRTRHVPKSKRKEVKNRLDFILGEDYDVILEENPPHIHAEYEPEPLIKKKETDYDFGRNSLSIQPNC